MFLIDVGSGYDQTELSRITETGCDKFPNHYLRPEMLALDFEL